MNQAEINTNSIRSFSTASLVFGILSVILFWTGIFPLAFGAMGVIFAVLSRREDRPFPSSAWWGCVASFIGIFMGLLILYFVIVNYAIPLMTDPAFYQEMNEYYLNTYGISLDEMLGLK